jgi:hypothetical protein
MSLHEIRSVHAVGYVVSLSPHEKIALIQIQQRMLDFAAFLQNATQAIHVQLLRHGRE